MAAAWFTESYIDAAIFTGSYSSKTEQHKYPIKIKGNKYFVTKSMLYYHEGAKYTFFAMFCALAITSERKIRLRRKKFVKGDGDF